MGGKVQGKGRRRRPLSLAAAAALLLASGTLHALVVAAVGPFALTASAPVVESELDSAARVVMTVREVTARVEQPQPVPLTVSAAAGRREHQVVTADAKASAGLRYFEVSEVDTPAIPRPDWALDAQALASVGVRRLVFQVFVGRDGIPRRCEVLSMEPAMPDAWPGVQQQICTTRLEPAVRRGVAVPNVRRIELVLDL